MRKTGVLHIVVGAQYPAQAGVVHAAVSRVAPYGRPRDWFNYGLCFVGTHKTQVFTEHVNQPVFINVLVPGVPPVEARRGRNIPPGAVAVPFDYGAGPVRYDPVGAQMALVHVVHFFLVAVCNFKNSK